MRYPTKFPMHPPAAKAKWMREVQESYDHTKFYCAACDVRGKLINADRDAEADQLATALEKLDRAWANYDKGYGRLKKEVSAIISRVS